jgi:single-strand DNA-binding protein
MANDLNCVFIVGRLTRDMEVRYASGGMAIGKFSLAVNRKKKSGEQWIDEASFFDVTCFGKTAENLSQYMTKGKQVGVGGSLHQDRWEKDGHSHSRVVINADNIQLLGGGTEQNAPSAPRGQPLSAPEDYGQRDFPDDVPF